MRNEIVTGIKRGLLGAVILAAIAVPIAVWITTTIPGPCDATNLQVDYTTYTDTDPQWTPPLTSGDHIRTPIDACGIQNTNSFCTLGLIATDDAGDPYGVTAAHCIESDDNKTVGDTVHYGNQTLLGTIDPPPGDLDVGRIQIDVQAADPYTLHLAEHAHTITGTLDDPNRHIGVTACHAGTATLTYLRAFNETNNDYGTTCGTVYQDTDGEGLCFTAFGTGGDSGSLVFQQHPDRTVTALGILSTAIHETNWRRWPDHSQPSALCYIPIAQALTHLDLVFPNRPA